MAAKKVSVREYARLRNVSHTAIQKHLTTGRLVLEPDGKIAVAKANKALRENLTPSHFSKAVASLDGNDTKPSSKHGSYIAAKTKTEEIRAKKVTLEYRKLLGELVEAEFVDDAASGRARQEREALLNWPVRISADMAASLGINEKDLLEELERRVRSFLAERSDDPETASVPQGPRR